MDTHDREEIMNHLCASKHFLLPHFDIEQWPFDSVLRSQIVHSSVHFSM